MPIHPINPRENYVSHDIFPLFTQNMCIFVIEKYIDTFHGGGRLIFYRENLPWGEKAPEGGMSWPESRYKIIFYFLKFSLLSEFNCEDTTTTKNSPEQQDA
jgi:hypothetical protein